MAMFMVKPWYKKNNVDPAIYGAEWAGTSSSAWTRTDAAANFADPSPQYKMSNSTWSVGSSPFDGIMPWAGMRIVEDSSAGTLVEIPKFYYKWTRSGTSMKLQITSSPVTASANGFYTSPAHADRGDGVGERDYVYIGRYHCASDYKSKTGVTAAANQTRASFRSSIHNLGANIWQHDFAMWWTINMLYLVEFADWDSQKKIGYGCGNNSSVQNMGASDSMPYHTGTMQTSRTTYGVGVQYRYIEGLWENTRDWCDGVYFNDADAYCIKNPVDFSDSTGGTKVGTRASSSATGFIKSWSTPSIDGFEYALFPASLNGNTCAYICDFYYYTSGARILNVGGNYSQTRDYGIFYMDTDFNASVTRANLGSRLMVLPSSRIS